MRFNTIKLRPLSSHISIEAESLTNSSIAVKTGELEIGIAPNNIAKVMRSFEQVREVII